MENTVKVVENHEGGTGLVLWQGRAEAETSKAKNRRDRSRSGRQEPSPMEGIFGNPKRGAW
jgi:hypothetical protein